MCTTDRVKSGSLLGTVAVRQSHNLKVVSSILTGGIFGNPVFCVMKSFKSLLYNYGKLE